jgi:hypothetical protein
MYQAAMRLLYGRHFDERYAAIAEHIPTGTSVVDVCAGDCYLYRKHLRRKSVAYLGLDASARLVGWARRQGVEAREFNLWIDDVPGGDIVLMQASLYQFVPHEQEIVKKLIAAARGKVIISEPIHNLSSSRNPLMAALGRSLTVPTPAGHPYSGRRFERDSLSGLFRSFDELEHTFSLAGGKEMAGIFRGRRQS